MVNMMKPFLKKVIPKELKSKVRQSDLYKNHSNNREAKKLASTSKRIDLCSIQVAHNFHLSKHPPIRDKICLELGSGWVLSHATVFHLLGAKKVIATDLFPLACPAHLKRSLSQSFPSIIRDNLAPFEKHDKIRKRLNQLLSIKSFSFDSLKNIGIEYLAPMDFAKSKLNTPVDFIYSFSVLEHVPLEDIPALMKNLVSMLNNGGTMLHSIHLEDHRDFVDEPFAFLSEPLEAYSREIQSQRGNRLRKSHWREIFNQIEDIDFRFIYEWNRLDKALPQTIDPSIKGLDEEDLRSSHLGVYVIKR